MPSTERQSLREYLREQVDPSEVWTALKAALESGSQTAVVSAARLLVTELYEDRHEEDEAARRKQAGIDARAKLEELMNRRVPALDRAGKSELAQEFRAAAAELWADVEDGAVTSGGLIVGNTATPESAAEVLRGLEEIGLIRRPLGLGELDEVETLRAQVSRLETRLSEFTGVT